MSSEKGKFRWLRLVLLVLIIVVVIAIPTLLFEDQLEAMFGGARALEFVREQGPWGGVVAIALIMADLFVPIPSPAIMAALGLVYGAVLGGLIASAGSFMAANAGYGLCRALGPRAAKWIAGDDQIEALSGFFAKHGLWAIALSRWVPAVPEVLSCLAGLTRMPFWRFTIGNAIGSAAVGFAYAWFGDSGQDNPTAALGLAFLLPYLALPLFFLLFVRRNGQTPAPDKDA